MQIDEIGSIDANWGKLMQIGVNVAFSGIRWHSVAFNGTQWQSVAVCGSLWLSVAVSGSL